MNQLLGQPESPMVLAYLAFGLTLFVAVLLSSLAARTILSTAVIFLLAGFVCGDEILGIIPADPSHEKLARIADLALFAVLFTDGMRVDLGEFRARWKLPVRVLIVGMPLTLVTTAALAHFLLHLSWMQSLLVGAVLSPTDPVFASAIIGREEIPGRTKQLLNVESGINDGLALPMVLIPLSLLGGDPAELGTLSFEILLGIVLGVAIPWAIGGITQKASVKITPEYKPLMAAAVALILFVACALTHANEYLAAFSAGVTLGNTHSKLAEAFREFGELVAEILKLAALMSFGAMIAPSLLGTLGLEVYAFAFLALFLPRLLALSLALWRSSLSLPERWAVFWFGPKGFASVVYGLLVVRSVAPEAQEMFEAIALVIVFSMIAHSSTDVPIAHWFRRAGRKDQRGG